MSIFPSSRLNLRTALISLFSQKLSWRAEELLEAVERAHRKISKQALYKELRRLEDDGVVVRASGVYTIRLAWILQLSSFANKLHQLFLETESLLSTFEFKDGIEKWEFSDLHRADLFWTQLIIALLPRNRSQKIFSWIPHPWFHLVHADREKEFWNAVAIYEPEFYVSVAGDTPLDREWANLTDSSSSKVFFGKPPLYHSNLNSFELHGDFLVEVKLDKETAEEIEQIFISVPKLSSFKPQQLMQLLGKERKIIISLEHNTDRIETFRRLFSEHFKDSEKNSFRNF
ncbi:MAG: hypothetical protein H6619_00455 [Deltaproteobacteria bacterium]|nr:hypothetical protein [Deltaproteobacteria bacterium]